MLWDASSTTPVTPAADQIDGACAPATAAHANTNTAEMSDLRLCGIGIHLSCLTVLTNTRNGVGHTPGGGGCNRMASSSRRRAVSVEASGACSRTMSRGQQKTG